MDTQALATFVAVAEARSFSQAAERQFMTQPAVSKRIAALEENVGARLFDRLGRSVALTEGGERLLVSARRILADIATSREEIRCLSEQIGGRLRLGTSHHVGIHRLPPILKAYTQTYPGVELDLLFMDSERAFEQVIDGSLELAVVTLPERDEPGLQCDLVWPDPLRIVCAPDHPLVRQMPGPATGGNVQGVAHDSVSAATHRAMPRTLNVHDLAEYPAVLPARGTVTRNILLHALAPFGLRIDTSLETNYLETIKMMVSVGLGWSTLPQSMIDDSIVALPLTELIMQRRLGCVRLRQRTLSRAAQALLALLHEAHEADAT